MNNLVLTIGPQARADLAEKIYLQYQKSSLAQKGAALDLTCRACLYTRKRYERNPNELNEHFIGIKGYYTGFFQGIARSFSPTDLQLGQGHDRVTLLILSTYKKFEGAYGQISDGAKYELEPIPVLDKLLLEVSGLVQPMIVQAHPGLKALDKMIQSWTSSLDDTIRQMLNRNIESASKGMISAGFELEVEAIRELSQFEPRPRWRWMDKYHTLLLNPDLSPKPWQQILGVSSLMGEVPDLPGQSSNKPRGLQKCTPEDNNIPLVPTSSESSTSTPNVIRHKTGLQKCVSSEEIGLDDFKI